MSDPGHVPAWSVIVPTLNRPERLASCVRALAALRAPEGGFEIVVVNDGGTEPPASVQATAVRGSAVSARFITRPNGGPALARNEGASLARGRLLAFTDDDCAPAEDWLLMLDGALANRPDALVGGAVLNGLPENVFSETSQVLAQFVVDWFDGTARERFFTSNNIALARTAFLDIGGFYTKFRLPSGEDREFCHRWHSDGRPAVPEPRALVRHYHELDLRSFLRQHFAYGAGARTIRAARKAAGHRVRIDPRFYVESLQSARRRGAARGAALAGWTAVAHAAYAAGLAAALLRGTVGAGR